MFTEAKKVLQRKTQQIFLMKKCETTEMEAVKGCTVRENRFALSDCHSYETVSYFSSLNFISLLWIHTFSLTFRSVPYFLWHVWSFAIYCLFKKVCVSGTLKEKRKLRYLFLVLDSYPFQKWSNQLDVPFFKHHSSTLLESSDKIKLVREEIWAGFKSKTGSSNTAFKREKKKKKKKYFTQVQMVLRVVE